MSDVEPSAARTKQQPAAGQSFNTAPLGIGHRAWRPRVSGGSSRHAGTSRRLSPANYCTVRAGRSADVDARINYPVAVAATGLFPVSECRRAPRPASYGRVLIGANARRRIVMEMIRPASAAGQGNLVLWSACSPLWMRRRTAKRDY